MGVMGVMHEYRELESIEMGLYMLEFGTILLKLVEARMDS